MAYLRATKPGKISAPLKVQTLVKVLVLYSLRIFFHAIFYLSIVNSHFA